MMPLLLFGAINIAISVYFWSKELQPFLNNTYTVTLTQYEAINIFKRLYSLFVNVYRFFVYGKYLVIDISITAMSISMLGFGDAVSGGILGLFLSNCISVLIILVMNKHNKALTSATN